MPKPHTWEQLSSVEDFLEFFDLAYDPQVVNVNRLHIMKKFSLLMREVNQTVADEAERMAGYQVALLNAYETFVTSSAIEERLFKVHQDYGPKPIGFLLKSPGH